MKNAHPAGLRIAALTLRDSFVPRSALDDYQEPEFTPQYREVGHSILTLLKAGVLGFGLVGICAGVVAAGLAYLP